MKRKLTGKWRVVSAYKLQDLRDLAAALTPGILAESAKFDYVPARNSQELQAH